MSAQVIDGKVIAAKVREQVAEGVAALKEKYGYIPGLATVLVGEDPASATYVRSKQKMCESLGIRSSGHHLPADASQADVQALVTGLNANPEINGILVQLPLPKQIDEEAILNSIDLTKDVDGFHPVNIGRLAMKGRDPLFIPCTPAGCMVLLEEAGVTMRGAEAVIVGRSNIVGLPMAMLLQKADATVTICHSRTRDLREHLQRADIVVAAIGRAEMITGDMLKPGTAVIDVGINRVDDPTAKNGYRLVGDVHYESAIEVAGAITPVPGGVGPMTIAMLMQNTLRAAEMAVAKK
ncbi:MAG: bifunctional methylenetetrahydrofolate dehydrogenase/methenyltetrahydrofolate cyclohydrolase FolD [Chloroflexi bacterium]|nr:bifunctional methylenetetrahydrofolate dehydrogenase/methenyltetrahydrofolate cyclohydrolase FolD [Ardenticatenaceae bacterium]MBL1128874.1 bifunctional methylenetetrahydrofolate dehydrogenase/methenyltetrahydrofolate cyclohydrolase FolD [Chloroflexota bacterium]NOG34951.1 bifunctional methylenetetrahydrofolate dehydrogenase/methenyltetrahydrofolate cyclohydrolase FolD [Chloroflexota bacterium]